MIPELDNENDAKRMLDNIGEQVGIGILGSVFAVTYDSRVVLKEYRKDGLPAKKIEDILEKMSSLYRYKHVNLPRYGIVIDLDDFTYIPMSRHDNFLYNIIIQSLRKGKSITNTDIFNITYQVANGLAYLHNPNKKDEAGNHLPAIVHGNLKPCNVIFDKRTNKYLVADFGIYLSRQSFEIASIRPPIYLSPETMARWTRSAYADMWSLGVILYELVAQRRPRFAEDVPGNIHVDGWVPTILRIKNLVIRNILEQILVFCPEDRISAVQYMETLDDNIEDIGLTKSFIHKTINAKLSTFLIQAAYYNDLDLVKAYVASNTFIRASNDRGMTALMYAAKMGHSAIVKELVSVEHGLTNIDGWTALMWAARHGRTDAASILLEYENKYTNNIGRSALMIASFYGSLQIVKMLLKYECKMKDNNGKTALMHAAKNGRLDVVKLLLQEESTMVDQYGRTAIMYAAAYGYLEIVKVLLPHEGDIRTRDGEIPLHFAARAMRNEVVEFLDPTDSNGVTALMRAMNRGDIHLVKILYKIQGRKATFNGVSSHGIAIENNWDLYNHIFDPRSTYGITSLMLAAMADDSATVKELIPLHATKMIKYSTYRTKLLSSATALMHAAYYGSLNAAKLLVNVEACMVDAVGRSALMLAIFSNNLHIAELLVERENKIVDKYGTTALIYLAGSYILEDESKCTVIQINPRKKYTNINHVIKLTRLLAPYEVELTDLNGWTSLMHAINAGQEYLVDILISNTHKQSIAPYKEFPVGTTALMIAIKTGQTQIVQKLACLEKGFFDANGMCALMIALEAGHISYAFLLLDELHALDVNNESCYMKILKRYENRLNTNRSINSYLPLKSVLLENFISQMNIENIHRLLKLLALSFDDTTSYHRETIDMFFVALCCECESAATMFVDYIHELTDESQETLCAICMSNQRNCTLLPCRHLIMCLDCLQLMQAETVLQRCPYCRNDIADIVVNNDS